MQKVRFNLYKFIILVQVYCVIIGGGFVIKPLYHWNRNIIMSVKARTIWIKWNNSQQASGELTPEAWISIPGTGIHTLVIRGDSKDNLLKFPCLIENGNRLKNDSGTKIVSAHRDMHFRDLEKVKIDDLIKIELGYNKKKVYRIYKIQILSKEHFIDELETETDDDILVLLTCYPFRYLGPAPQRYLVWAKRI